MIAIMPIRAHLSDDQRFVITSEDSVIILEPQVAADPRDIATFRVAEVMDALCDGIDGNSYRRIEVFGELGVRWTELYFEAVGRGKAEVSVEVECSHERPSRHTESLVSEVMKNRFACSKIEFSYNENHGHTWLIKVEIEGVESTFQEIYDFFDGVARLVDLDDSARVVDLKSARRALSGGVAELLVGLRECSWLEVKSQLYDLTNHAQRIELAKDVAQFANSPEGGLLAIGARTKNKGSGDRVEKLCPTVLPARIVERYRNAIDQRVFPSIAELEIASSATSRGGILYVYIPPQAAEARPYTVEGAVAGDDVFENFFTIPQRRGDASYSISARSLHSLIAGKILHDAGRKQPNATPNRG